jgi:hypothetical protein
MNLSDATRGPAAAASPAQNRLPHLDNPADRPADHPTIPGTDLDKPKKRERQISHTRRYLRSARRGLATA